MISDTSTVYNYTLAKKVRFGALFRVLHSSGLIVAEALLAIQYGPLGPISLLISFPLIILLHRILIHVLLQHAGITTSAAWKVVFTYPFFTYLPTSFVGAGSWKRIVNHLLVIGTVVLFLPYFWIPRVCWINFILLHGWLMCSQLWIRLQFRALRKPGFIRFQGSECSFYYT